MSDLFYSLKHSEIKQFYDKTMVHFCKCFDVHMVFVEKIIEAVSSIAKRWPKSKWIYKLNVWSIAY